MAHCPPCATRKISWGELRPFLTDRSLPGLTGPGGERVPVTEPRYDSFVCFTEDDFEAFYLLHVLGIDPSKEVDRE